ncbi:MAG: TIGR00730 family Rossman fold protein [Planctomycetota bacterium]
MKRICVFCGSSRGANELYAEEARQLGKEMAARGITVVYGAGNVGLMNELADAALENHGQVIGVIPKALVDMEVVHSGLTDLKVVETMHQRKALMAELSDAFIALPGGIGTMEEILEALTWTQLGIHQKPCALLNTNGYYEHLLKFLERAVNDRFLMKEHSANLIIARTPQEALDRLRECKVESIKKWIA